MSGGERYITKQLLPTMYILHIGLCIEREFYKSHVSVLFISSMYIQNVQSTLSVIFVFVQEMFVFSAYG